MLAGLVFAVTQGLKSLWTIGLKRDFCSEEDSPVRGLNISNYSFARASAHARTHNTISRANVVAVKMKKYLALSRALIGCQDQGDDIGFRLEVHGVAPQSRMAVRILLRCDELRGDLVLASPDCHCHQGQMSLWSSEH